MDSLSCVDSLFFFPSSSFVFMLAATMRGSFIIHAMIDVPVVAVFMLQSHQTPFTPTARSSAKHSSPQIKMLGVGFQLPFSRPHSVVRIVCWCLASEWLCTGKFSRQDNPKMFSWAVLTCRSASVSQCLSLSILKQIALSSLFSIFSNPLTLTPITQRAPVASFQPRHWS